MSRWMQTVPERRSRRKRGPRAAGVAGLVVGPLVCEALGSVLSTAYKQVTKIASVNSWKNSCRGALTLRSPRLLC